MTKRIPVDDGFTKIDVDVGIDGFARITVQHRGQHVQEVVFTLSVANRKALAAALLEDLPR